MSTQTVVEEEFKLKNGHTIEIENRLSHSQSENSIDLGNPNNEINALRPKNSRNNSYNSINESNELPKPKEKTFWQKFFSLDSEFHQNEEEKKFVRKLDIYLLTWGVVLYILKNVDQANYKNAYVSGMKEDLNMSGSDYNWLSTYYTIGYAIAAIPCQILMTRVKASYFMGGCELVYGICTALCSIPGNNVKPLFAFRFIIGAASSSSWQGMMIIFFNYYNKHELGFRAGLIGASAFVGQAITGALQAGIYKHLNGAQGIAGWRWLYIINGACMTIPIAVLGLFILPDTPANGGARWMTKREVAIALKRVHDQGRVTLRQFKIKECLKAFKDKKLYFLLLAYMPWDLGLNATSYINLWLQSVTNPDGSKKYSVEQINIIPIAGYITGAIGMIVITKVADITRKRIHALIFQQLIGIFGCIILSIWPRSLALKYIGFFVMFLVQSTGAILMSFVPELWAKRPERRAVVTSIIVILDFANNSWLSLTIWNTRYLPRFSAGYKVNLAFEVTSLIGCLLFYFYLYKNLLKQNQLESLDKIEENIKPRDLNA